MLSLKNLLKPQGALFKLLKYKGIHIDSDVIKEELGKHPDSPSLLAVSDVLAALNIDNSAFRVEFEELDEVECPFLAHTNVDKGDLVVVTRIEGNNFYLSNDKWEKHKLDGNEFKKIYTGIVMQVEATEKFATSRIQATLKEYKIPLITVCVLAMLVSSLFFNTGFFSGFNWQTVVLAIVKTAGLITATLLLVQSIDSNNPLVQAICQGGGKTDCNAILSSKAANVFDGLTWSEVGFFYFAGTWLLFLFGGSSLLTWQVLAIMNFISLPYTFYSIYYQSRVARQWCVLCSAVQVLLWLEFIPLVYSTVKGSVFAGTDVQGAAVSTVFICLTAPVVLWVLIKPLFLKIQQIVPLKRQLRQFKYNTELFNQLLAEQPKYDMPGEEWSIVLGNADAKNVITMLSGPYCAPCANMHGELDELLEQNDSIQVRIVFKTQNMDAEMSTPVSRHLMAIYALEDKEKIKKALSDWYGQNVKNYESWAKKYPVALDDTKYYKLDKQRDWSYEAGINATPTLLLNGHRLPDLYQLKDLKYMLA